MVKKVILIFVFTSVIFSVYAQSAEIKNFWSEFKIAVIKKDTLKLASMIDFSDNNGMLGKDTAVFFRNFHSIFDEKTIEIIAKTESLTRKGNNEYFLVGSGAYKFLYFKKTGGKFKLYNVSYYD